MRRFSMAWISLLLIVFLPAIAAAQDVNSLAQKGIASMEAGKFDQALSDFNAALKLKPNDAKLYDYRGMVYRCKNMNDQAIQDFNQAMKLDPKFARPYRNRAMVYSDLGKFDKCLADLNKAKSLGYKVDEEFRKLVAKQAEEKK
ncbi:MAG: tetratricopeptide repeat protein [Thermodesulfobacteriota bacterium]